MSLSSNDLIRTALDGAFGDDPKLIAEEGIRWIELLIKKNINYGSSVFKNPRLAQYLSTKSAILVRMSDKIERLESLSKGNNDLVGESFEDTIKDLGAYCLLYLVSLKKDE